MKRIVIFVVASCFLWMACNRNAKKDPNAFEVNTITVEDSVHFPEEMIEEWMYDDMASYLCVVDAPVTDNEDLRDNIINWIGGFLSENYNGDSQDVKAMVEFEKNEFLGPTTGTPESQMQHFIVMEEDNDRFVTYVSGQYVFMGGAHGNTEIEGATFSKKDGTRFSFDMFVMPEKLTDLIKEGLENQYFNSMLDGTEVPFSDVLSLDVDEEFPLPKTNPWIKNDSVFFIYQTYEIAAYYMGLPQCGFPYSAIKDALTDEGKAFFE